MATKDPQDPKWNFEYSECSQVGFNLVLHGLNLISYKFIFAYRVEEIPKKFNEKAGFKPIRQLRGFLLLIFDDN